MAIVCFPKNRCLFSARILPLLLAAALPAAAHAQNPSTQPAQPNQPAQPVTNQKDSAIWKRPLPPVAWTVTFKYNSVVPPDVAAHRPVAVKVSLIGDNAAESIQFPSRTAELWKANGLVYVSEAGSDVAMIRPSQLQATSIDPNLSVQNATRNSDGTISARIGDTNVTLAGEATDWMEFADFDWIKPDMLKGKIELGGELLAIYSDMPIEPPAQPAGAPGANPAQAAAALQKAKALPTKKYPPGPLGGLPLKPGIRVAAISESSKLPRYLQLGEDIHIYTFSKPTQTAIEFPPKIAQLFDKPAAPVRPGAVPAAASLVP